MGILTDILLIIPDKLALHFQRSFECSLLDILAHNRTPPQKKQDAEIHKESTVHTSLYFSKRYHFFHVVQHISNEVFPVSFCPEEFFKVHGCHLPVYFITYAVAFNLLVIESQH